VFNIRELNQYDLGWIVGKVVDADSLSPIVGASITADGLTTTTDANGCYVISNVTPGDYTVTVSAAGYRADSKSTHLDSGVTTTVNFEKTLVGSIDGTVTDASTGLPIDGASINVDGYATTTNADGYYQIDVPHGDYTVTASATGYLMDSKSAHVVVAVTTTVNFTLSPAGTLSVNTTPIAGEVFVNDMSWGVAPVSRTVAVGTYNVSFGDVADYYIPAWQLVTVEQDAEKVVTGVYEPIKGTLTVTTTPVFGEVFVDGISWGTAPQSELIQIGTHNVSFGAVVGYYTPAWRLVTVSENVELPVNGAYTPITGTLTITTTPVAAEIFINGTSWGIAPQSRAIPIGTYTVTFVTVKGYYTPTGQATNVYEGEETTVEGVYKSIPGMIVKEITNPKLVNATNPFIVNATKDAATSLIISEISDPITIVVQNVTEPEGVDPPPGIWKVLGNYVQINVSNTDITVKATIRIYYTLEQLEASGLDESTLKIHYWNTTLNEWVAIESHVNTEEHFVWANIDHFSLWALMGQPATGTLTVSTSPVDGDIYVDSEYKATGYWSEEVEVGTYTVSFGPVEGYYTPANQTVEVLEDQVTNVTGEYVEIPPPALAWTQFLPIVGIAVAIIAIVAVILIMRKRKITSSRTGIDTN